MKKTKLTRLLFFLALFAFASCEVEEQAITKESSQTIANDLVPSGKTIYVLPNTIDTKALNYIETKTSWSPSVRMINESSITLSTDRTKAVDSQIERWYDGQVRPFPEIQVVLIDWEGQAYNNLEKTTGYQTQVGEYVKVVNKLKALALADSRSLKVCVYGLPFSYYYAKDYNLPEGKFNPIFAAADFISPTVYLAYAEHIGRDASNPFSAFTDRNEDFLTASIARAVDYSAQNSNKPIIPLFWWRIHDSPGNTPYEGEPNPNPGWFWDPFSFARFTNILLSYSQVKGVIMWDNAEAANKVNFNLTNTLRADAAGTPGVRFDANGNPSRYGTSWRGDPTTEDEYSDMVIREVDAVNACSPFSYLPCNQIKKTLPIRLSFGSSVAISILDKSILDYVQNNNKGTGFTMVDDYSGTRNTAVSDRQSYDNKNINVEGYEPAQLALDFSGTGTLKLTTNKGIASGTADNQLNALGVQVASSTKFNVETVLVSPPDGVDYQQAGVWFGSGDKTYLKLVVLGDQVELRREINNAVGSNDIDRRISAVVSGIHTGRVSLRMVIDVPNSLVTGYYSINGGAYVKVGTEALSIAGMGLTSGTTYAGIFGSHRNSSTPLTYTFDSFDVYN